MTGKNIQLIVFILLAAACVSGSVYLFWAHGHFSFWLLLGAWLFGVIGVLTYYSEKTEYDPKDPYADDHHDHHDVAHH